MLQADNITFVHGAVARRSSGTGGKTAPGRSPGVHDVSLHVRQGEIVGILGPNGSGKTTLLRLLAGLLRPAAGRIVVDGRDLHGISRKRLAQRLAVVPQETHLAFEYSVVEIALMGRYPHLGAFEIEGPRDLAIVHEALDATGTAHLATRAFSTLSGGEKQRVIIASALAQEAGILLLDEPTASLDLGYQFEVAALLRRLNAERGLTLVIATHDLNFAASLCSTLVLITHGAVMAAGPVREVLTAANVEALYGVRAEVHDHPTAGHLTVVPLARSRASEGMPQ